MTILEGSYTVMVTPFSEGGKNIDAPALQRFVDWQIAEGVPGLVPLGSTGEFLSITNDERAQVVETVVNQSAGRVPAPAPSLSCRTAPDPGPGFSPD